MYEELIDALRNNADHYMTVEGEAGLVHLLTDAADAIEELSKENERFAKMAKVFIDGMNDISDKCADIAGIQAEPQKEETE